MPGSFHTPPGVPCRDLAIVQLPTKVTRAEQDPVGHGIFFRGGNLELGLLALFCQILGRMICFDVSYWILAEQWKLSKVL